MLSERDAFVSFVEENKKAIEEAKKTSKNKTQEEEAYHDITGVHRTGIKNTLRNHDKGKITSEAAVDKVQAIYDHSEELRLLKREKAATKNRDRGYWSIISRMAQEVKRGTLDQKTFDIMKWFLDKNKSLADDIAISIKTSKDEASKGIYYPGSRVVTLFKGHADNHTAVHEVLHHLERMMPEDMQKGVRKAWMEAVLRARLDAIRNKSDIERVNFLEDILMQDLSQATIIAKYKELFQKGLVSKEDYKFVSPSEYWAVKLAEKNVIDYTGSVWDRAAQWLKETVEKVKSILGLPNDAALYKAFDQIIKGEGKFVSKKMLANTKVYYDVASPNAVPKYTSIGQIKGMLEKSTSVIKLFKDVSITPMIGALSFQENLENKLSTYVKQGMDENIAYEKAIEEATQESKNGPTSRMWFENHRMNTTKSDATYYMATSIEDGKIVNHFENAVNTYNELTDKERSAYNALLDQGDIESKEYVTLQEAKDAVKNRFGVTSSEITQNVYDAYLQFRKAANNKFAAQNMLFFNDILDSIVDNNVPADKIDAVKDILTKHIYKKNNSSKERINRIKDDLFNIGITKSQYEAVVESLYPMLRVARSVLRNYVEGGVPGRVKRYRKSKADNPYVVRIFETKDVPIKEGSSETKKVRSMRFATFFPTEATMNDFVSRIKTDNDIRMLFNGEDINVDNFKVNGKVDIVAKKEINAIIDKSFQTSDSSRIATNAMLDDVIKQMKNVNEDNESLVKAYETIRKQIIGVTNLTQIRSANNAFRSRKRGNIRGYDQTNPLTVLREDASQIAGFLARKDYINRMTKYALTEEGDRRIEATKLLQDSFTKYRDSDNVIVKASAALSNAAPVSFMTFRVITATAQAHQYFLFGVGEMTTAGATETEALRILASNYVKLSLVRLGISASDLRAHLSGDKMLAKAIRSSMPKGGYRFILEALDAISVKEKVGSKDQNKFYNRIFERDEIELLLRHRNNNDVSDNLTKEMNNFEWSEKEAFGVLSKGKDFIGGIANAGMILFNEMEVLNREASLLSMYQFRKSQGDSSFVADVKATSFMLRVNSDFNSINKIGFLRKHPELSALFALTGYAFHATGLLGYRTLQAFGIIKSKSNGAKNFRGLIAYIIMGGLLGGMKGEPFWDILNKFWSKVVGHNVMLEFEEAAKSGDHNKITQKIIDFAFRGAPALIGVDWSSNVALRPPMVDSIMDFATNKNTDLGQTGAGLSWASGLFKALGTAAKGEYSTTEGVARTAKRTIEDLNIGGISQWIRAERYKEEGYTTKSGTPIYVGDKPRKLSDRDAVVYKTGFKTLEMARTQEVVNDQISIGKEYWEKKRSDAINNYFKLISPYINKNQSIPKGIQEKAVKEIIQFNNKLSLASKGTLLSVDPIVGDTISRSLRNRYKPNKRVMGYQGTYNSLLNGSHDSLSSDAEDD